ncbi:MAG: hypothetical protein U1E97_07190 [Alphaproteobacteria bacterium]
MLKLTTAYCLAVKLSGDAVIKLDLHDANVGGGGNHVDRPAICPPQGMVR